ncbi:MAG TPA: hypothetical protein VGL35_09950 [Rhizomicrobium sp.]
MGPLADSLARSPELFPLALDLRTGMVNLIRLARSDYEQASFLDGRIAAPTRPVRTLPFPDLARAVDEAGLGESCDFIFHLGHVGSTLLSRLLGRHPALFSLREPEILRTLAQAAPTGTVDDYLAVFLKLWSRTFDPRARALVKTTSFVSELAPAILARPYAPRALAISVGPEIYLATIFGGENAPMEARALAISRSARLERRTGLPVRPANLSEGETVAMGWACEATSLAAAKRSGALMLDFDRFLADPEQGLALAFAHLGVEAEPNLLARILSGPEMRTYSKAPQHAYDRNLRRAALDQGRRHHAAEIRRGLEWLNSAARENPLLGSALDLFGE